MHPKPDTALRGSFIATLGLIAGALGLFLNQFSAPQPFEGVKPMPSLPTTPFRLPDNSI